MKIVPCAIVPTFNHWTALPEVVTALRHLGLPVFVIDDGSSEPARYAIASLEGDGVTVLRLERNAGKGAAVLAGFRLATAAGFTHAVQIDADGQHDTDALPALMAAAMAHPDSLISGAPVYDDSIPLGRKIGRWITHLWVFAETLSFRITDSMCGFRIYPLAAVTALLAQETVGARMDFDTDIMVRLFWRGIMPVMVPVRVSYPPDNTSNFDLLHDNLRITRMHSRLVFTRLGRMFAAKVPRPSHWAGLGERGALWGLRVVAAAYGLLGRRACLWIMAPIVAYFFATGGPQRRASKAFLGRTLNRQPDRLDGFRHFMDFAGRALDAFAAWSGGLAKTAMIAADPTGLAALAADRRGCLMVVSHHGNAELSRALLDPALRDRLTVLVHTRHAENYNRLLAEFRPEAAARMIQVTEIGPDTAILLQECIARGDWVAIAGDRIPVLSKDRCVRVPFLGAPAAFSQGPWLLAALLNCPVHLLFCRRDRPGQWSLSVEPFAERIELPRGDRHHALTSYAAAYAQRLEAECRRDPWQWYNFFDFWADGDDR